MCLNTKNRKRCTSGSPTGESLLHSHQDCDSAGAACVVAVRRSGAAGANVLVVRDGVGDGIGVGLGMRVGRDGGRSGQGKGWIDRLRASGRLGRGLGAGQDWQGRCARGVRV